MTQKPWEHAKSAGSESDDLAARFVESLSYDTRLYKHDIAGSIAHARMLEHVGLITADDLAAIERGLNEIQDEIEAADVTGWSGWKIELEDVHMCIEAALIEKIGEPGKKLHTGRSRNDQVALDLRLWATGAFLGISKKLNELSAAFVDLASRDGEFVMPSFTHLQRAQPIVVGGELLAWADAFENCFIRFRQQFSTFYPSPLGSGAIAGSSLPLDRSFVADQLEQTYAITDVTTNSIQATASRDIAIDMVYHFSMTSMWLSRWAEQWIIYMTSEFGFLQIGDAYTTGSSMMPQKRNPDMLELIRGRCGNVYGHLVALLTMCKGITIGYNRDLQEDKRHVFAAYDTVRDCLDMATRIVKSAKFNEAAIHKNLDKGFLDATSLAEYLVTQGVPFRTAHQHVGALVRHCIANDIEKLADLSVDQMKTIGGTDAIDDTVYDWLGPDNVVKRYQTYGNAGLTGFREQLAEWKQRLASEDGGTGEDAENFDAAAGGDADTPAANLFGDEPVTFDEADALLVETYEQVGRTLDDLPYTPEFEEIYESAGAGRSRQEVFHRLHNIRKRGDLPKLGPAKERAPLVEDDQAALLVELVEDAIGAKSKRDQLPYTEAFDTIVTQFNEQAAMSYSPHQVWRIIAKLAK